MEHYDLIVIGGGGGTKLVRPSAALGKKVAVIEKESLGGTCLNRGCIPSKMLIHVADLMQSIEEAKNFGAKVSYTPPDFATTVKGVNRTIHQESQGIVDLYEKEQNVDYYHETAYFLENKLLQVGDKQLTADKIFIAVGAEPKVPSIPGLEGTPFMTYRDALKQECLPKKMIVIGGGYIAVELGYFYAMMGADVCFLVRSGFLRREDLKVREVFKEAFCKKFRTHLPMQVKEVKYDKGEFVVTFEKEGKLYHENGDALFVASGVEPNTSLLQLENTSIEKDKNGFIVVDDCLETGAEGVFAFGDCIGRNLFRHAANFEGEYLFRELVKTNRKQPLHYLPMPHAVFTHPQIASVGKTEEELQKEGVDYLSVENPYSQSAMGMALKDPYGFIKLLFSKKDRRLLGVHILGQEAASLLHIPLSLMTKGCFLNDLLEMIYIHPALAEALRNAARKAKNAFDE